MLQANFGTVTRANSQQRKLGDPCAHSDAAPGWRARAGGGGMGDTRQTGQRSTGVRVPAPRRLPPSPAREANESAAAAVSCFVAQVRRRAGAAPLHAGFPGTLPLAPLAAPRRCLAPPNPPRLLTKGFRIAIGCPCHPPCHHLAVASPRGSRHCCFEAQPGGRRGRARACVRRFCGAGLHQGGGKPGVERPSPATRGPRGAQAGLAGPQRAGVCDQLSAHLPCGDPRRKAESLGPLSQCSLPGLGVLGKSKVT